jgi:hypothetical protein
MLVAKQAQRTTHLLAQSRANGASKKQAGKVRVGQALLLSGCFCRWLEARNGLSGWTDALLYITWEGRQHQLDENFVGRVPCCHHWVLLVPTHFFWASMSWNGVHSLLKTRAHRVSRRRSTGLWRVITRLREDNLHSSFVPHLSPYIEHQKQAFPIQITTCPG